MKCTQQTLWEQGKLPQAQWMQHARTCPTCGQTRAWHEALSAALEPPAAPAALVDSVFANTTRRKNWFVRWRAVLASSLVAVLVGVGLVYHAQQPQPFNATELVAYMNQAEPDEYGAFYSDLQIFEQEF